MFYLLPFLFGGVFCKFSRLEGWNYINLHCRNNDNAPVDWWIIYKPPAEEGVWEGGGNFSYITSEDAGRWIPSDTHISTSSMLKHTLAPMFRPTYSDHLAVLTYHPKRGAARNTAPAMGVMLADEMGGLWIIHTVPGLPDITRDRYHFPEEELANGHLMFCLSADFITLNKLAKTLRYMEPQVLNLKLPERVMHWLPDWMQFREPVNQPLNRNPLPVILELVTADRSIRGELVVRRPGDSRCLYQEFARSKSIVLDVYGHHQLTSSVCEEDYGVRKIEAISLNYPNNINENTKRVQVIYVDNKTDLIEFGVSTAAHWQMKGGSSKTEYWACIGTSNEKGKRHLSVGSLIMCIDDYNIWRSFDILKIKEPEC